MGKSVYPARIAYCTEVAIEGGRLENGKYPTLRLFFVRFDINTA